MSTLTGWFYISSGVGVFLGSTFGSLFLDITTTPDGDVVLTGINGLIGFLLATLCILFCG